MLHNRTITTLATLVATTALCAGCSSDTSDLATSTTPTVSPSEHNEAGVQAALDELLDMYWDGGMTRDEWVIYCRDYITAKERDGLRDYCTDPYAEEQDNRELESISSITIDGDKAIVEWRWIEPGTYDSNRETDAFCFEDGRWRWESYIYYGDEVCS